jgi:GDPmannose 4,6-dehydratase|tara:strand:- start:6749 stop:7882 length:1134 start_codon:yes stop_codon:yes gene_type:complete
MKAIIFGITGQDGSYLAELLLEKGYEVVGVTRRVSVDTLQRINHILPQIKIVEGDITDAFNVSNVIKEQEPDEIYNLAAQSHVGTSFKQPSLTWDVTAGGVLNILEAIRYSARKQNIKFYQASSSEMFGKNYTCKNIPSKLAWSDPDDRGAQSLDVSGETKYQNEETPFMPQSPYAIAKLAAHHLVRNYRDSYSIFACSGILFNHESERRGEKFVTRKITKWIGEFRNWAMECGYTTPSFDGDYICCNDSRIPKLRLGNLEAKRDWGHAEDYVRGMWQMVQHENPDDYVIATGETYSVREFLDIAFSHIEIQDWQDYVVIDPEFYRPAEVDFLLGMPDKAKDVLGWEPEVSFKKLVERMVESDINETQLQRSSLQGI